MDLSLRTEAFQTDDQSWLASRHGINNGRSITLKTTDFTPASTYAPNGFIRSGIALKRNGDGTYSPWTTGTTFAGVLLTAVKLPANGTGNVVGALLSHGRVVRAKIAAAPDATGAATNQLIELV